MAAAVRYTDEQKQKFIADFKASGMGITPFLAQDGMPSYPVFSRWLKASEAGKTTGDAVGNSGSLHDEFMASLLPVDVDKKYIAFLEKKVATLEAQLAEALNN